MREQHTDTFRKTHVIQLLESMSKDELHDFNTFIHSPFHNNRRDVTRYFEILKKYHPSFDHQDLTKEKIFKLIYPDSEFKDDVIRKMNSFLLKCLRSYLINKKLREEEITCEKYFLDELIHRNLDNLAELQYQKCLEVIEKSKKGENYFKDKAEVEQLAMLHYSKKFQRFQEAERYYKVPEYWTGFSLIKLFNGMQNLISVNHSFNLIPDKGLLSTFIQCFDSKNFIEKLLTDSPKFFPLISIAYYAYKMKTDYQNEEHFFKLLDLLRKEYENLDYWMRDEAYTNLREYCDFRGTELKETNYIELNFELICEMEKKGMFYTKHRPYMDITDFEKCCYTAFKTQKLDWLRYFLNKYSERIEPSHKDNILNYIWAEYFYAVKNYNEALNYLARTTYKRQIENIRIKGLYIRIYYELGDIESLLSIIDSGKHAVLIKQNKFNQWTIKTFKNFLNIVEKMVIIRQNEKHKEIKKLKEKILNDDFIHPKPWLLEKIESLEKELSYISV